MDPFSTAAAAVGLIDVCVRFVHYVRQVKRDGATIRKELQDLDTEIEGLRSLCATLKSVVGAAPTSALAPLPDTKETTANSDLWTQVRDILGSCEDVLAHMGSLLVGIYGENPRDENLQRWFSRRLDTLGKVHRKKARQDDLREARGQLAAHKSDLQLFYGSIAM